MPILGTTMLLLVTGCSSGTPGQEQPSSTGGASTSTAVRGDSSSSGAAGPAPKVSKPLDASKMVANPCSALTSANVTALNITDPITKSGTNATASHCGWQGATGGNIGIGWVTANTGGLSDLYAQASTIAYWQPTTVGGYPAAYGDAIKDERPQGVCVLHVAVNDHLYFDSQYGNPSNVGGSCDLARQAASDVIRNLGGS